MPFMSVGSCPSNCRFGLVRARALQSCSSGLSMFAFRIEGRHQPGVVQEGALLAWLDRHPLSVLRTCLPYMHARADVAGTPDVFFLRLHWKPSIAGLAPSGYQQYPSSSLFQDEQGPGKVFYASWTNQGQRAAQVPGYLTHLFPFLQSTGTHNTQSQSPTRQPKRKGKKETNRSSLQKVKMS